MVGYFEIPVEDLDRAVAFYEHVCGVTLDHGEIHGHPMAFFPDTAEPGRITGALAQGAPYTPMDAGVLIYLAVNAIDDTLARVESAGGRCVFPRTSAGEYGFVAEFIDSEGNRIGLMETA